MKPIPLMVPSGSLVSALDSASVVSVVHGSVVDGGSVADEGRPVADDEHTHRQDGTGYPPD